MKKAATWVAALERDSDSTGWKPVRLTPGTGVPRSSYLTPSLPAMYLMRSTQRVA
jgi:hypothetical protein